jgi:hypothetical protein
VWIHTPLRNGQGVKHMAPDHAGKPGRVPACEGAAEVAASESNRTLRLQGPATVMEQEALLGKRARRPSSRAWGPRAIHENNMHSNTPCCLSIAGPGCGLPLSECNNRVLRSDQTEVRELLGIGSGVFALEDLIEGQWVGEYNGKLTVSRTRPSIRPRKQYTLCGSCGNAGWVVVDADNVPQAKRVLCHFINHACGASANW